MMNAVRSHVSFWKGITPDHIFGIERGLNEQEEELLTRSAAGKFCHSVTNRCGMRLVVEIAIDAIGGLVTVKPSNRLRVSVDVATAQNAVKGYG